MPTIVIPVHNRKAVTKACLENLLAQRVHRWAQIHIVDDGSADGTSEMLREFPVSITQGDGNLWWGGAIDLGMRSALKSGETESIIWLNDDCLPEAGSLELLNREARSLDKVCGGHTFVPALQVYYSGFDRSTFSLLPKKAAPGEVVECEALCGNMVCVPVSVITTIGFIRTESFPHHYADFDYTLRASVAGKGCLLLGSALAVNQPTVATGDRSILCSPKVPPGTLWNARNRQTRSARAAFRNRYFPKTAPILNSLALIRLAVMALLKSTLPTSVLQAFLGPFSRSWQRELKIERFLEESITSHHNTLH